MAAKAGGALLALGGALFARKNSRSGECAASIGENEGKQDSLPRVSKVTGRCGQARHRFLRLLRGLFSLGWSSCWIRDVSVPRLVDLEMTVCKLWTRQSCGTIRFFLLRFLPAHSRVASPFSPFRPLYLFFLFLSLSLFQVPAARTTTTTIPPPRRREEKKQARLLPLPPPPRAAASSAAPAPAPAPLRPAPLLRRRSQPPTPQPSSRPGPPLLLHPPTPNTRL